MTTNRSERIESAARAVVNAWDADGAITPACERLRVALASREEEPRWDVIDRRTGERATGADVKGYWTEVAAAQACGLLCGKHGFHFETRTRTTPIADTFPRAPKDAEDLEALTHAAPSFSCRRQSPASPFYACTRAKHHDGDHVAAGTADIKARWPQPAPAKGERWHVVCRDRAGTEWPAVATEHGTDREEADRVHAYLTRIGGPVGMSYSVRPYPAPLPAAASEGKVVIGWRAKVGTQWLADMNAPSGAWTWSPLRSHAQTLFTREAVRIVRRACRRVAAPLTVYKITRRVRAK